jgi:hypothetical protein
MTQAMQEAQERAVTTTDELEPSMVLFSDEDGIEIDDVELISLSSATLGAIVARRC